MEPFSLLKFWRNAGTTDPTSNVDSLSSNNKTNVDVRNRAPETDPEETDDEYNDDITDNDQDSDSDSFFDLVFTTPQDCCNKQPLVNRANGVLRRDSSQGDCHEDSIHNLLELESPLKSKLFPAEVVDFNSKPQSPISLLKSAPKFRVLLLGFKKSKSDKPQSDSASSDLNKHHNKPSQNNQDSNRFTTFKLKVEQVPTGSFFSRDNSLRSKLQRDRPFDFSIDETSKAPPKDVPMYLKLIKPLYIRASKRYSDKVRFPSSDHQASRVSPLSSPAGESRRGGERGAGFRAVSKHLGKSRPAASTTAGMTSSPANRRDDSLLLHNDGIQSAILHCKRSYNSPAKECSGLLGSCHGISTGNLSSEQRNRCSSI